MKNNRIREKIDRELSGITLSDEMKEKIRSSAGGGKRQAGKMMQTAAAVAAVMIFGGTCVYAGYSLLGITHVNRPATYRLVAREAATVDDVRHSVAIHAAAPSRIVAVGNRRERIRGFTVQDGQPVEQHRLRIGSSRRIGIEHMVSPFSAFRSRQQAGQGSLVGKFIRLDHPVGVEVETFALSQENR